MSTTSPRHRPPASQRAEVERLVDAVRTGRLGEARTLAEQLAERRALREAAPANPATPPPRRG